MSFTVNTDNEEEFSISVENCGEEYRFDISTNGKKLYVYQWDKGSREVDGTLREPRWVLLYSRDISNVRF